MKEVCIKIATDAVINERERVRHLPDLKEG